MRRALLLLCIALLCAAPLCGGCTSAVIREDPVQDRLPDIDPSAGMQRTTQFSVYYRLAGEPLLAPMPHTALVGPRDSAAKLALEQLIKGPEGQSIPLSSAIPGNTRVLEVSGEGGSSSESEKITVTFSREFLAAGEDAATRDAAQLSKRLSVYAVVNTLCSLPHVSSVQLLVDTDNSGRGMQVPPFMLGFQTEEVPSQLLGSLRANDAYVMTPADLLGAALTALEEGAYEKAYQLFAGGSERPPYEQFVRQFSERTLLTAHAVGDTPAGAAGATADGGQAYALPVDLTWQTASGERRSVNGADISFSMEQGLQLPEYDSLLKALEGGQ